MRTEHSSWIITFSGLKIDLMDPEANFERFLIRDVAHALSLQTRFNGHCSKFYSVAEHSLLVERFISLSNDRATATDKLTALLHDAPEYILGDMTSPQKKLDPVYKELEDKFSPILAERWDTKWPVPPQIKQADAFLYKIERRDLFLTSGYPKEWAPFIEEPILKQAWPFTSHYYIRAEGWEPRVAEQRFLQRFKELVIDRDHE